jgi:hypothetical protein
VLSGNADVEPNSDTIIAGCVFVGESVHPVSRKEELHREFMPPPPGEGASLLEGSQLTVTLPGDSQLGLFDNEGSTLSGCSVKSVAPPDAEGERMVCDPSPSVIEALFPDELPVVNSDLKTPLSTLCMNRGRRPYVSRYSSLVSSQASEEQVAEERRRRMAAIRKQHSQKWRKLLVKQQHWRPPVPIQQGSASNRGFMKPINSSVLQAAENNLARQWRTWSAPDIDTAEEFGMQVEARAVVSRQQTAGGRDRHTPTAVGQELPSSQPELGYAGISSLEREAASVVLVDATGEENIALESKEARKKQAQSASSTAQGSHSATQPQAEENSGQRASLWRPWTPESSSGTTVTLSSAPPLKKSGRESNSLQKLNRDAYKFPKRDMIGANSQKSASATSLHYKFDGNHQVCAFTRKGRPNLKAIQDVSVQSQPLVACDLGSEIVNPNGVTWTNPNLQPGTWEERRRTKIMRRGYEQLLLMQTTN